MADTKVHQVVDKKDFEKQVVDADGRLIVIDFFATWCGPCKMISPHLAEMSKAMDNVIFLKVDVDECEDIAADHNITAMPTFIFMKGSVKVDELMGANVEKLKEKIQKNL